MKILGAILIVLSSFGMYETMEHFQKRRLEILRSYKNFAKELKRCFAKRLEKSTALDTAEQVFPKYVKNLADTEEYLESGELELIHEFLRGLGKNDLLSEQKRADSFILEINELYEESFMKFRDKRKLNRSISIFAGIFIAIILF